jgi:Ribose 5-phosphate isomerase RpiB
MWQRSGNLHGGQQGGRCTRGILRDVYDAEMTRRHNNANVACLGARVTPLPTAKQLISIFLATPFEGGRHTERVRQLR